VADHETSDRVELRFRAVRTGERPGLIPYFTAGFPRNDLAAELVRAADALDLPVIEIGFPFSDSIADGPVIQASHHASLSQGQTLDDTFQFVRGIRPGVSAALVGMVSYSIVFRSGMSRFVNEARGAGLDGLIVPDAPFEEVEEFCAAASAAGLVRIGLIAPTTPPARRHDIAKRSSGFLYQIASAGTTGERSDLSTTLAGDVAILREASELPIAVGFGIHTPEQVRAVRAVADAAIVGSALVRRIADAVSGGGSDGRTIEESTRFLASLCTAARCATTRSG
jgi:tryptophan synthase alpha chain